MADTPVAEMKAEEPKTEVKESPAKDIREIQYLLVNGIFPGNVAPQVVKAYQLLDKMAVEIEKNASK
jgi:hypothetical protein